MNGFFALILLLLFQFILPNSSLFNIQKKLKDAVDKGKNIYNKKFGKNTPFHFLGHDASEYPGTDKEKRKIQKDRWDNYYECLRNIEKTIIWNKSLVPFAIIVFEGESVKLDCQICLSPAEMHDSDSIEWEWKSLNSELMQPVEYDEHVLISPQDRSLQIFNTGPQHTGQYMCKLQNQTTTPYFLTVTVNDEPMRMVRPITAEKGPYAEPAWKIHSSIILDTVWTEWSPCSECNTVGKRHKYGHCIVMLHSHYESMKNEAIDEESHQPKISDLTKTANVTISEHDLEFLKIFKYGIPCRSHILLESIRNIKQVKERKSEVMIGYCKIKCPKNEVFVLKDRYGNIIETANNSAGIYSMAQGLPPIDPPIDRKVQYEELESAIKLTCPGNLNKDVSIEWQTKGKIIIPEVIAKETGGRIYISITDILYIGKAQKADSGIYSCWQEHKLVGTIRLVVEKRLNLEFSDHIKIMGMAVIMATFVYVLIKAVAGRKYTKSAQ